MSRKNVENFTYGTSKGLLQTLAFEQRPEGDERERDENTRQKKQEMQTLWEA